MNKAQADAMRKAEYVSLKGPGFDLLVMEKIPALIFDEQEFQTVPDPLDVTHYFSTHPLEDFYIHDGFFYTNNKDYPAKICRHKVSEEIPRLIHGADIREYLLRVKEMGLPGIIPKLKPFAAMGSINHGPYGCISYSIPDTKQYFLTVSVSKVKDGAKLYSAITTRPTTMHFDGQDHGTYAMPVTLAQGDVRQASHLEFLIRKELM